MGLERVNILTATEPFPLHPMAEAFRPWDKDEAKTAEASMETIGQLDPVIVYAGHVIDGANRQRLLVKAGMPIRWVDVTDDLDRKGIDPSQYVIAKNVSRRHLTSSERAVVVAKLLSGGDPSKINKRKRGRPAKGAAKQPDVITSDDVARVANVSEFDARAAVTVVASGRDDLISSAEQGEVHVRQAARIASGTSEVSPENKSIGLLTKVEHHMGQIVRALHDANTETPYKGIESCRAALNAAVKHIGVWKDSLLSIRESIKSTPSRQ